MSKSNESGGKKNDAQKPDLSLIPTDALWGMAEALTYGAKKYDRHNFRKGIAYSRLVAACMRHLSAWNEGEDLDPESGLCHLDHALASLAMLKFMTKHKTDMDDRFIILKNATEELNNLSQQMQKIEENDLYCMGMKIQMRGR